MNGDTSVIGSDGDSSNLAEHAAFIAAHCQRLTPTQRLKLLQRLELVDVLPGQTILKAGDPGLHVYYVKSGSFQVIEPPPFEHSPRVLNVGARFGEHAVITGLPEVTDVIALDAGMLLRLCKEDFHELVLAPLLRVVNLVTASRLAAAGACWLDAREERGWVPDYVAEAIHLPASRLRAGTAVALDASRRYLVFCADGSDSALVTFLLAELDYGVSYLAGGISCTKNTAAAGRFHARSESAVLAGAGTFADALNQVPRSAVNVADSIANRERTQRLRMMRIPGSGLRSELPKSTHAERMAQRQQREAQLMQRLRTDVQAWRDEQAALESSPEHRHRSAHLQSLMDAVKRKATAAKVIAKLHDQRLLDELTAFLEHDNDR